jgi:tetratricopeptide (TPR) repeat protein
MRSTNVLKIWLVAFALLGVAWPQASARGKAPRDEAQAIQWAQEALTKNGYRNVDVNSQYILFGDAKGNYGIALARINNVSQEYSGGYVSRVFWQDYARDQRDALALSPRHVFKFEAALEYMAENARTEAKENLAREYASFETQLKTWREAAVKPTMPEAAREHQVLAEFAFKEKNVDKAISEYLAALSIFPTWPEGQYNLATLAGEKKMYELAIQHMKEYLELAPNSSDAQAAQDSVIIWKDKLQSVNAALQASATDPHGKARRK